MPALTLASGGYFDSGASAITVGTGWTLIGLIPVGNRRGRCAIELLVGVAALTNLKVTRGFSVGATHVDLAVDADLNQATTDIDGVIPIDPHLSAAGTRAQLLLNCDGVVEYAVYARSGGTATLRITGRLPREF